MGESEEVAMGNRKIRSLGETNQRNPKLKAAESSQEEIKSLRN